MATSLSNPVRSWKNPEFVIVKEFETGLFYKNGKLEKALKPGMHRIKVDSTAQRLLKGLVSLVSFGLIPIKPADAEVMIVDTRLKTLNIAGQEMLTLDKVPVRLNLVAQYRVEDAEKAVNGCENFLEVLYQDIQMSARNYTSNVTLDSLLVNKDKLGKQIMADTAKKAREIGIELKDAGLKDVVLPGEIKTIMSRVIAAEKEAKSKLVLAREEVASARALANAAKIMSSDPNILVLKRMELLREISKNPANKVYFGDSMEPEFAGKGKRSKR